MTGTLVRLLRVSDRAVRVGIEDDVGITELGVLATIQQGIELPSVIARTVSLDPARVTRIVDVLARRGYVERGADADDRRRCPLRLTTAGRERLDTGRAALSTSMIDVIGRLPTAKQSQLTDAVERIRVILDASQTG
ncbi:MAG TPA: MarR family winged helix-turn-helix transcriptional regulator [Chloroflexota bacterium]|jgi:DNA-binding MarR family transcriptional regulator|nr:MarR family winged helix-turn-helix transcriptional regulator [Chloroflexota bacterium]